MSKEIVITIVILLSIILLNVWVGKYVDGKLNHVLDSLSELRTLIEEQKYDEANKKIEEIDEDWQKHDNFLSFFIEHDELEKVMTEYTSLKTYFELEQEEAFEALDKMAFIIKHIEEKDDLRLKNIF